MLRKQWKDYWMIGKIKSYRPILVYAEIFIFPIYVRLIFLGKGSFTWKGVAAESLVVIGFLLVLLSQYVHPLRPGKMYYLCPRSREERLKEIRAAYHFRSLLHLFLLSMVCIALYLTRALNGYSVAYVFLNAVLCSFLSQTRDSKKSMLMNLFLTPAIIIGSALQFALPVNDLQKDDHIFLICCVVFFTIAILPAFRSVWICIREEITEAADYGEAGANA